jgi:hypothetical protein
MDFLKYIILFNIMRSSKSVALGQLVIAGVTTFIAIYSQTSSNYQMNLFSQELTTEDYEFLNFVARHQKQYSSKEEFLNRSAIFKQNLLYI